MQRRSFLKGSTLIYGGAALPAFISGCSSTGPAPQTGAELILYGGDIYTMDSRQPRVSALAIGNGKVIAAGSDAQINELAHNHTRRVNLDGRTVLPGINDSHLHLLMWGLAQPPFALDVTFPTVKSIADITRMVGQAVDSSNRGEWIVGRGWDQAYLAEARPPTRQDLDQVAPNHPVVLTDFSGHAVWANSVALKLAGVDANTQVEAGGVIVKDANGEPTGVLFETAAWQVRNQIPAASADKQKAALRSSMQKQLARGITSATDPLLTAEELHLYAEVAGEAQTPKMRMAGLIRAGTNTEQLAQALSALKQLPAADPRWLQFPGVKIMGDGIPTGNKTAWLNAPYEGGGNGSLLVDGTSDADRVQEITAMIDMVHRAGLQIGAHVTGDRSIDTVVNACLSSQRTTPRADPRHYLIHADLVSPATLERMAVGGIGANFNPEIKHLIADSQVASIGPVRAAYEWPYRTALDKGVIVASSSDAPVTPGNYLQGLATCVTRIGKQTGQVSGPEQRISLLEAIATYTVGGAWQDRAESWKGALRAGYAADLCVLDGRLAGLEPALWSELPVTMTLVDGRIVHNTSG